MTVCEASEKVAGLQEKLSLWSRKIERNNFSSFEMLHGEATLRAIPESLYSAIKEHLMSLRQEFTGYFPNTPPHEAWIYDPFHAVVDDNDDYAEELLD